MVMERSSGDPHSNLKWILIGLLVLAVLLAMSIYYPSYHHPAQNNKTMAYDQAKEFIRIKLKVPSTAEFPARARDIIVLKDSSYNVISWVDADNGSGARLRADWRCDVADAGDGWRVVTPFGCGVDFARKLPVTLPPDPIAPPPPPPKSRRELERDLRLAIEHRLPPPPPDLASKYKAIHTNDYGTIIEDDTAPCYYDINKPKQYVELHKGTKVEILARRESDQMYAVRTPWHVLCWADSIEVAEVEKIQ
jgi:hypothetical protein